MERLTDVRPLNTIILVVVVALTATACASAPKQANSSGGAKSPAPDLPKFAADFARTCTDGIGFAALPAYPVAGKATHTAALLEKSAKTNTWSQNVPSGSDYPPGWILGYQDKVETTELVVCYQRTAETPAGKVCDMQDEKTKQSLKMTMYNTTYRLRVLEARTGKVLYDKPGDAKSTDCPYLAYHSSDEDTTKYYTEASPADYRGQLKPFITPSS
jgi:hypothetical protein